MINAVKIKQIIEWQMLVINTPCVRVHALPSAFHPRGLQALKIQDISDQISSKNLCQSLNLIHWPPQSQIFVKNQKMFQIEREKTPNQS